MYTNSANYQKDFREKFLCYFFQEFSSLTAIMWFPQNYEMSLFPYRSMAHDLFDKIKNSKQQIRTYITSMYSILNKLLLLNESICIDFYLLHVMYQNKGQHVCVYNSGTHLRLQIVAKTWQPNKSKGFRYFDPLEMYLKCKMIHISLSPFWGLS